MQFIIITPNLFIKKDIQKKYKVKNHTICLGTLTDAVPTYLRRSTGAPVSQTVILLLA